MPADPATNDEDQVGNTLPGGGEQPGGGDGEQPGGGDGDDDGEQPGGGDGTGSGEGTDEPDGRLCQVFNKQLDSIAFAFVYLPCPELIERVTLVDAEDASRVFAVVQTGEQIPWELPLAILQGMPLYKYEVSNVRMLKVCVDTVRPINPNSLSVLVKEGNKWDLPVLGGESCECPEGGCT